MVGSAKLLAEESYGVRQRDLRAQVAKYLTGRSAETGQQTEQLVFFYPLTVTGKAADSI